MREEKGELGMFVGQVLCGCLGSCVYCFISSFLHLAMC